MQELTDEGTLESMIRPKEGYNTFGRRVGFVFCFHVPSGLNKCFGY